MWELRFDLTDVVKDDRDFSLEMFFFDFRSSMQQLMEIINPWCRPFLTLWSSSQLSFSVLRSCNQWNAPLPSNADFNQISSLLAKCRKWQDIWPSARGNFFTLSRVYFLNSWFIRIPPPYFLSSGNQFVIPSLKCRVFPYRFLSLFSRFFPCNPKMVMS